MTKINRGVMPKSVSKGGLGKSGAVLKSGRVPAGDVRLTANIRAGLHMKLRIRAVEKRTTVGRKLEVTCLHIATELNARRQTD